MSTYRAMNAFAKVTGWPAHLLLFRTKVYYEDKAVQSRRIRGPAILISNHTSIFDYAAMLFVFPGRTLRYQMAEVLYRKPVLGSLLKWLGGILVDRDSYDFAFVRESVDILKREGVVGIFPESRLPTQGEERPLPFKTSATYIALDSGAPVIPVYTNGCYFTLRRARVIIGTPIHVRDLWEDALDEKTNIDSITSQIRAKVVELGNELERRTSEKQAG